MTSTPVRAVLAALGAVMLLASACSGSDDSGRGDGTSATASVDGGIVRVGLAGPVALDPAEASLASPSDLMVLDLLHDGLTRIGPDGSVEPALARAWEAEEGHKRFRFRLDPAATFASGRQVLAADVIASYERVMRAGDASLSALSLETVNGFGDFAAGRTEHVSGLSAPDPTLVQVDLATPLSVLPAVLASPLLGVVDVAAIEAAAPAEVDLSGAWTLTEAGLDKMRLDRREGSPGSLDAVELHSFEDEEAAYDAFDDGTVDWAAVPGSRVGRALEDHGDDHFAPFHAELFFGMNIASPALADLGLRQAIQQAIDRDAIVRSVYPELASALSTVVPEGVPGHDADRCTSCGHDSKAADAAVAAVFPAGDVPTVRIDYDDSPSQEAMARIVAADLGEAGIPTELRPLPFEEYKRFVVSGGQELFSFGWIGAYRSPDAYLAPLFGSAANDNLTNHRSEEVDALLSQSRGTDDASANAARWAEAESRVLQAAVVVPIAQFRIQVVVAERVVGLAHAVDGTVDWSAVKVTG